MIMIALINFMILFVQPANKFALMKMTLKGIFVGLKIIFVNYANKINFENVI